MACRLQLIWCTIILQLMLSRDSTALTTRQFTGVSQCPTNTSELQQQQHCKSKLICAAVCSGDVNCGIFHFNKVTNTCFHGNTSCSGLALWSDGPCESYTDDTKVNAVDPIVQQLSLKLLYRFATNGLVNVADPSQSKLQPGSAGVPLDHNGAHFVKDVNSYLVANTSGFENIINKNNQYSMFVRVKHPLNTGTTYLTFRKCDISSSNQKAHEFFYDHFLRGFKDRAYWSDGGLKFHESQSGSLFSSSSAVSQLSAGVTFNMDHHENFYFNGTMKSAVLLNEFVYSSLQNSWFQCLHLGGAPETSSYTIEGSMSCFALSTRLLTLAEFVQLDSWCGIT